MQNPDFIIQCENCSKTVGGIINASCFEGNFICSECYGDPFKSLEDVNVLTDVEGGQDDNN